VSRILLIAKGSFGDVFPMFAIARALHAAGHAVTCAVPMKHHAAVSALGLTAVPLRPPTQATRAGPWGLRHAINTVLSVNFDGLAEEYTQLSAAARDADLLIGNQIAFVTPMLAETLGKHWVYCAISPLAVYSAFDPPLFPGLHLSPLKDMNLPGLRTLERTIARLAGWFWAKDIARQRRRLGLPSRGHPLFEGKFSPDLNLFLCSPSLVRAQPDWPANMQLTGFCWFEPDFPGHPQDRDALNRFLSRGEPPVLLLLGSDSRTRPGRYYHVGIEACRRLGLRAIGYLPYAGLIGAARVVIHSAGIGTLGWCLRHGKYSILTPGAEDQFDNARRAQRMGYARVIPRRRFSVDTLVQALRAHLDDPSGDAACLQAAREVAHEDGTHVACAHIQVLLGAPNESG